MTDQSNNNLYLCYMISVAYFLHLPCLHPAGCVCLPKSGLVVLCATHWLLLCSEYGVPDYVSLGTEP